jgi:hypothetical protein
MRIRFMAAILTLGLATSGAFADTRANFQVRAQAESQPSAAQPGRKGVELAQDQCMKNASRKCCYDASGKRVCK